MSDFFDITDQEAGHEVIDISTSDENADWIKLANPKATEADRAATSDDLPLDDVVANAVGKPCGSGHIESGDTCHIGVTDTPAFKAWFGKSTIVNKDGTPRVLYHGTAGDFTKFKLSDENHGIKAAYFTDNPITADNYVGIKGSEGEPVSVMPVYVRMEHPFVMNDADIEREVPGYDFDTFKSMVQDVVSEGKHDGIIVLNARDDQGVRINEKGELDFVGEKEVDKKGGLRTNIYIVLDPKQVKSATGNRGTFNPKSADITNAASTNVNPKQNPNLSDGSAAVEPNENDAPDTPQFSAWAFGDWPEDRKGTVKSDGPGVMPQNTPMTDEERKAWLKGDEEHRKLWQEHNDRMMAGSSSDVVNAGTSEGVKKGWETRHIYYHGYGRESGDTIHTKPGWEENFFVSHRPEVAKMYGPRVDRIEMQPDTKILVEHSPEYKRLDRGNKAERLLDHHIEVLKRARAAGYHVVEFNDFHDTVGHVILDPTKIAKQTEETAGPSSGLKNTGTSEGVRKAWETRKQWADQSDPAFVDLGKMFASRKDAVLASGHTDAGYRDVRISDLHPTQDYIGLDKVAGMADNFDDKKARAEVVEDKDGNLTIYDGHHTLAAAKMAGRDTARVHLYVNPGHTVSNRADHSGVIAVDFDGVLAQKVDPFDGSIGSPIQPMIDRVRAWIADGKRVTIFTARASDAVQVPMIKSWLEDHGLPNMDVTNEKRAEFTHFYDDRATKVNADGTLVNAGQPCGDSFISPGDTCHVGVGDGRDDEFLKQMDDVVDVRGNHGKLLAPNGNPSNLSGFLWKAVRTPNFKQWFGDWEHDPKNASKAVDGNGEPKVLYHGTTKDVSEFAFKSRPKPLEWKEVPNAPGIWISSTRGDAILPTRGGSGVEAISINGWRSDNYTQQKHFDSYEDAKKALDDNQSDIVHVTRPAFFFASNPLYTQAFTKSYDPYGGSDPEGGRVMPVFLNVRKPLDFRSQDGKKFMARTLRDQWDKVLQESDTADYRAALMNWIDGSWSVPELVPAVVDTIKKAGYDGYTTVEGGVFRMAGDSEDRSNDLARRHWGRPGNDASLNFAVFNPNQIKSAFSNRGTYSRSDNKISNKKCGSSGTADGNVCHVGETAIPFGLKAGQEIVYTTPYGPEVHKLIGATTDGLLDATAIKSYRHKPGEYVFNLDPALVVTKDEAKNIENANAYLLQDTGGATQADAQYHRGMVLDGLTERSHVDRGTVNEVLQHWAESSNDHDDVSLLMQHLAETELGAKMSGWQKERFKEFEGNYDSNGTKSMSQIIKAMHEWSTEDLSDFGIKEVTLYRGIETNKNVKAGDNVNLETNAIESWSTDPLLASSFARGADGHGIVVKATFPIERILSSARTGFGVLHEHEFTVLNNGPTKAIVTKKYTSQ